MQIHRHILFASIFTILLFVSGNTQAQTGSSSTQNPWVQPSSSGTTPVHGSASVRGAVNGEDWSSMDFEAAPFLAKHPRIAKAMKFLNDENYRAGIEAPMTSADKQAIESAVADAKSNIQTLKGLRPQYKTARIAHDSAALYQLEKSSRPNFDQLLTDHRTIIDIIAKYKFATPSTTTGSLLDPVYPNPVHLGGAPATISYHTTQSGPVKIVVTDGSGNTVQEIANDTEGPGDHTVTLGTHLPGAGTYYVTVESNGVKTTQKVAAVQ